MKGEFELKMIIYLVLAVLAIILIIAFLGNVDTIKEIFLELFTLG